VCAQGGEEEDGEEDGEDREGGKGERAMGASDGWVGLGAVR
jgi:hypothetical protein